MPIKSHRHTSGSAMQVRRHRVWSGSRQLLLHKHGIAVDMNAGMVRAAVALFSRTVQGGKTQRGRIIAGINIKNCIKRRQVRDLLMVGCHQKAKKNKARWKRALVYSKNWMSYTQPRQSWALF